MEKQWSLDDIGNQVGRIAIVTGANTGLGYETALVLAGKGAHVVLACRNKEKAEEAETRIRSTFPSAKVEVRLIDTGSLKSVRDFAEGFRRDFDRLDLLINNAGIMMTPYFRTEDGFEGQLGVNHLGHFLLTGLLLPLITNTPASRVVSLYSITHRWGGIRYDDINYINDKYDTRKAYSQSKMACLMFGLELDRRLKEAGHETLSLAAHPGFSQSDLTRHMGPLLRLFMAVAGPFICQPTEHGAWPTLYAALREDLKGGETIGPGGSGERKGPPAVGKVEPEALDQQKRDLLWQLSEELCGFKYQF